jgi:SAM-dependent methyltransferase
MLNRNAVTLDPFEAWFVEPSAAKTLDRSEDGILQEPDSAGTYADIPSQAVKTVLDALAAKPWRAALKDLYEKENPWLYRIVTDPSRAMPMELLNLTGDCRCLDVGSGWGQLSIPMAEWGCRVVALDLTLDRLRILRGIARQEGASITLAKGNILSFPFRPGVFDFILFNGTLEWVGTGRAPEQTIEQCQIQALQNAARAARSGGIIYVGIENSLGLKYLMGARDDHTHIPHYSFRTEEEALPLVRSRGGDRPSAKTWDLNQLKSLAARAGLNVSGIFACFPDYKLPRHLVPVDEVNAFILKWEIDWEEHHGDNGEPLPDQDAIRSAYRRLADNGIAQWFCPSFAVMLVKP